MDEQQLGEILTADYGDVLAKVIDALAKAAKEHDRFITLTLTISKNEDTPVDDDAPQP